MVANATTHNDAITNCEALANSEATDSLMRARLHSALSWLYAQMNNAAASEVAISNIPQDHRTDPIVANNLGNTYLKAKRFSVALAQYDEALSGVKALGAIKALSGTTALSAKTALSEIKATAAADTERATVAAIHFNRSLALRGLGRYENAFDAYQAYLLAQPAQPGRITDPAVQADSVVPDAIPSQLIPHSQ